MAADEDDDDHDDDDDDDNDAADDGADDDDDDILSLFQARVRPASQWCESVSSAVQIWRSSSHSTTAPQCQFYTISSSRVDLPTYLPSLSLGAQVHTGNRPASGRNIAGTLSHCHVASPLCATST